MDAPGLYQLGVFHSKGAGKIANIEMEIVPVSVDNLSSGVVAKKPTVSLFNRGEVIAGKLSLYKSPIEVFAKFVEFKGKGEFSTQLDFDPKSIRYKIEFNPLKKILFGVKSHFVYKKQYKTIKTLEIHVSARGETRQKVIVLSSFFFK